MKYRDFKMMEQMFKDQAPKKKDDSEMDTFFKVYKAVKKFEAKEKSEKKEEKKEDKKNGWESMSVLQKLVVLTAIVPFVFTLEFLLPVMIIMKMIGVR